MMGDMISRKAVIEAIVSQSIYETREAIAEAVRNDYKKSDEWLGGIDDAISAIEEMNAVPAVPLDKLCVLLKELNESGYSFQCAFCKKAFPAWCDEKNTDIGWDREFYCPTWEEITEWMVKLDAD